MLEFNLMWVMYVYIENTQMFHNVILTHKLKLYFGVYMISGFKFSRASYVLSLLRSQVFNDLELKVKSLG